MIRTDTRPETKSTANAVYHVSHSHRADSQQLQHADIVGFSFSEKTPGIMRLPLRCHIIQLLLIGTNRKFYLETGHLTRLICQAVGKKKAIKATLAVFATKCLM